jgi:hypothetical protein
MDALNPVITSLSSKLRLARCDIGKNAWAEAQYKITAYVCDSWWANALYHQSTAEGIHYLGDRES